MRFALIITTIFITLLSSDAETRKAKIGVILPETGAGAVFAESAHRALILASEEINAGGQIAVKLIFEDSRTEPKHAVSAYQRLTSVERVDAVIGDLWDFLVAPLIPLSKTAKTVTISPTVMDFVGNELNGSPYFWSLGSKVETLKEPLEQLLTAKPDLKRVGIFCWNNFWGEAHTKVWKEVIAKHGREVVAEECETDFASDLRSVVTKITRKNPDLILASTIIGTYAKRKFELKSQAVTLSTSDIIDDIIKPNQDNGMLEGFYFSMWQEHPSFVEKFKKRFGSEPYHEASKSYFSLMAIRDALLLKKNDEDLATALKRVVVSKPDGGRIDFSIQPFANSTRASLMQYTGGKIAQVQ